MRLTCHHAPRRLFFGDSDSGNAVWDCDCRPSDGCWLALKARLALVRSCARARPHSRPYACRWAATALFRHL
jgi:hypothetical protein